MLRPALDEGIFRPKQSLCDLEDRVQLAFQDRDNIQRIMFMKTEDFAIVVKGSFASHRFHRLSDFVRVHFVVGWKSRSAIDKRAHWGYELDAAQRSGIVEAG